MFEWDFSLVFFYEGFLKPKPTEIKHSVFKNIVGFLRGEKKLV